MTKFFIDRGANITVTLTSDHYRKSPLVQGGMEIACKVTASIHGTCIKRLLVEKYKKLVEDTYKEPKNEEILGYLIQHEEERNQDPREIVRKRKEKIPKKKEVKKKIFVNFFGPVSATSTAAMRNDKAKKKNVDSVIQID